MNTTRLKRRSGKEGFSLAELMVVIVIIGLLATVVLPNVWKSLFKAKRGVAATSISALRFAAESYARDKGSWPDSLEQLVERDSDGLAYLQQSQVPKDPWGNEFLYEKPRAGESLPSIFTYGADGAPGGEGQDGDITLQDVIDGNVDG
ncbi:MAG: general secretion pathway protein G [Planctomycetota bacterium]|jgi:general secretion pathway protein G